MSGFSKLGARGEGRAQASADALDLSDFKPAESSQRDAQEDQKIADRVAQRHNLAEEPIVRVPVKRGAVVNDNLFVKGPIVTLNRFRQLCNDKGGITYADALRLLLDHYDASEKSR
ncbi:MAG: hypothetical protein AAF683_00270 [Pseudomonadota bacterium]